MDQDKQKIFRCQCGKGNTVQKISKSKKNYNRVYYACPLSKADVKDWGCGYFLWEDELRLCPCGQGLCIAMKNREGVFYKCPIDGEKSCGYEESVPNIAKKVGAGISSSSPGPFTPSSCVGLEAPFTPSSCVGLEANCSNCKLLAMKIKILQAKLDLAMHPEDHPSQIAATLHELFNELLVEDK